VRFPSPSEVWVSRVSPSWLRAFPPRRSERPRGLPRLTGSRDFRSGSPLVEFESSPEFLRLLAARPSLSVRSARADRTFARAGSASRGFPAPSTPRLRAPRSPETRFQVYPRKARSANSSPVPSSGLVPSRRIWLLREPFEPREEPANLSRRPEASRPCFMPLACLESPFRAFPSWRAVPALAGPCFPAGSRSTTASAARASPSHRFRHRADPLPRLALRLAGRRGQDVGFPRC